MGINMLRPCMALNMHLQVVVRYFHNTSSLEENVGDNEDLVNKKKKNTKEDKENKKKNTKEDKENKKKNTKEDKENMCSPEDLVNKKKKNTKEDKENKKKNTKEDLVNNNHTSETYNEETNNKEDTDSDSDSDTNTKQDNWINWKLIKQDQTNARDYLLPKLSEKDANLLQVFNQYTIEALIVHLLAQLFNNSEDNLIIRVATLIEQLDLIVRNQASFFKSRMKVNKEVSEEVPEEVQDFKKSKKKKKINDLFPIGIGLVEFLEERKLIEFTTDIKSQDKVVTKKDIQQARYERFILRLAQAYDGYQFYLPVFLDFRGRIYRCGLLHFHERDLVRSLIIMSWLLLDTKMAVMTNLIPSGDFKKDVYLILLEDLKKYISSKLNNPALSDILQRNLDRKIVKSIFMPLIYGKTIISTIDDIKKSLLHYLTQKECVEIAKLCFEFWKSKYDQMNNLIVLIRSIGYFVAYINRGVIYSNPYYVTIQDYMKMDKIKIWIYDKNQKKRRQVTLKMASSKRDCRKTEISTFVNFIHQKDAQIAMSVIQNMNQDKKDTKVVDPHPGLIIATHDFKEPYPLCNEIDLLSIATMDLLNQYVYPSISGYCKFTITMTLKKSYGENLSFTRGSAIPLTYQDCTFIPINEIYSRIKDIFERNAEIYDGDVVIQLMIRVYMDGTKKDRPTFSFEDRYSFLSSVSTVELSEMEPAREIINRKKRTYSSHITKINASSKRLQPFLVGDLETIMINNVHKPYAAGLMLVSPTDTIRKISMKSISTYFSEDYDFILDTFVERSTKVLYDLILRIHTIVRQEKLPLIIYFHNFSRFDGILLLKHLACHHASYKLKPLMRNNRLYEIAVYSGNKMLFRFRDSLNHLPGKLDNLAKSLCPDLDHIGKLVVKSLKRELKQLQIEKKTLNEKFMNERELDERKNTDRSMLTTPKTDDEDEDLKPPDSRPEEKNT
ncbi:hypothetical protein VNO80_33073 [Phaseolus coccineus]|uniref:DNA-directed RNA polymerase n=1 Tax=Phaseolus coccineus TaxID=3886 RepID=A0AAN9L3G2_PHACN